MSIYERHRFPRDIIAYVVWLYYHFNLSRREIGDLLAEREIIVSRDAMRLWCITFGTMHMRRVIARHDYSEAAGYAEIKVGSAGSTILIAHAAISNVFNFGRQVIRAETFRHLRKVRLQNGEGRLLELAQCHS